MGMMERIPDKQELLRMGIAEKLSFFGQVPQRTIRSSCDVISTLQQGDKMCKRLTIIKLQGHIGKLVKKIKNKIILQRLG